MESRLGLGPVLTKLYDLEHSESISSPVKIRNNIYEVSLSHITLSRLSGTELHQLLMASAFSDWSVPMPCICGGHSKLVS